MKARTITIMAVMFICGSAWAGNASDILNRVKKEVAPDSRQVVYELTVNEQSEGPVVIRGVTSEALALKALTDALTAAGVRYVNEATVYPSDNMALVSLPVATMRTAGRHSAEMASQAVMGTPVRVLTEDDGWCRIQTPDGYIAWVPDSSIKQYGKEQMQAWKSDDKRLVVSALWQTHAFKTANGSGPRDVVTDLVLGAIVQPDQTVAPVGSRIKIILPDGRSGWAEASELQPIREWADQPFDSQKILNTAYSLEGAPYLWGGTSIKCVDCSGLAKVSYLSNGIILRRDASQQALTGRRLEASQWREYQQGDLMFIGNASTGRVTHVAIYDGDGYYIHSSGRVKRNSVDPESPDYLYSPLHSARIHGMEGTEGIVRVIDHPWYF